MILFVSFYYYYYYIFFFGIYILSRLTSQDFGLKHYGGPMFKSLQQRGGEIFVTLKLEASNAKQVDQKKAQKNKNKPNRKSTGNASSGGQQWSQLQAQPAPQAVNSNQPAVPEPVPYQYPAEDNSTYYNTGGCFDAACVVQVKTECGLMEVRTFFLSFFFLSSSS
jgi:hypothetical protein